jgi:hypothetical protein
MFPGLIFAKILEFSQVTVPQTVANLLLATYRSCCSVAATKVTGFAAAASVAAPTVAAAPVAAAPAACCSSGI